MCVSFSFPFIHLINQYALNIQNEPDTKLDTKNLLMNIIDYPGHPMKPLHFQRNI